MLRYLHGSSFTINDAELNVLKTMFIDASLLMPTVQSPDAVELPICICGAIVILKDKHDVELTHGKSFLEEDMETESKTINELAEQLVFDCDTFEDCKKILLPLRASIIFRTIINLIARFKFPLIPLSEKTVKISQAFVLLEPVHPYDFTISEVVSREALQYCMDIQSVQQINKSKKKSPEYIRQLIGKLYACDYMTRKQQFRLENIFNRGIFRDIQSLEDPKKRLLIRFIIRNMIFMARRYIHLNSINLRKMRKETWDEFFITTRPHIVDYVYSRIADVLSPILFSFPDNVENSDVIAKRTVINMLCTISERMWIPKHPFKSILINMEPSYCHVNCVCGRGASEVNLDKKEITNFPPTFNS